WKIPLFLSLAAVGLFLITFSIDKLDSQGVLKLPAWLHFGGIDDCRALLGALMGAVSTVLALIFSVALLVLSMVATLFGPRLLYRFIQDPVTQITIGLFMATFVYLLLAFLVEQQEGQILFIPQLTIMTSWVLVLISFSSLVWYSHRIATSIQNPDMIARIVDDFDYALEKHHAIPRGLRRDDAVQVDQDTTGGAYICRHSGYLQSIHHQALVEAATKAGALVALCYRPGQFVLQGETLAYVYPASALQRLENVITPSLHLGRHRVLEQDSEFGIYQIVEIAIRALSPAVNDTFTGVACVDWLADALVVVLQAERVEEGWYDAGGVMRVLQPEVRFSRLARVAFDQIRQASSDTPAVLIRMLTTLNRLSPRLRNAEEKSTFLAIADSIWETTQGSKMVALDMQDVESAYRQARTRLISE
ncbi:unnamed protein product, partial [Phaeothamnion confervicola]